MVGVTEVFDDQASEVDGDLRGKIPLEVCPISFVLKFSHPYDEAH